VTGRELLLTPTGRLRAPWRLVLFALAVLASFVLVSALLDPALAAINRAAGTRITAVGWREALALLLAHALMLKWVERRSFADVWLDRGAARARVVTRGFAIGALAIGLPSLLLLGVHWLAPERSASGSWFGAAALLALTLAPAALFEELLFRGYAFQALRDGIGVAGALVATSLLFAAAHWQNPGANAEALVNVGIAGLFIGAVLLATRSLYAAWAMHFAWNWTMAALFHMAVSGQALPTPGYVVRDAGPDWATGGDWGPEGGAAGALGMIGGLLFLARGAGRRGAFTVRPAGRGETTA